MSEKVGWIEFYIRSKSLGKVENAIQHLNRGLHYATTDPSAFYYCGKCGEIWGKIEFEFGDGWIAQCHLCKNCGGSESLVDSNSNIQDLPNMPKELITYEFTEVDHSKSGIWRAS